MFLLHFLSLKPSFLESKILKIVIGQIKDVIVGDIVYGHRNGAPIKKVVNPKVLGPQFIIEGGSGRTSSWEREEGRASEGLGGLTWPFSKREVRSESKESNTLVAFKPK